MNNIINNTFKHKNGATRYTHIKVGRNKSYFTSDPLNGDNKYTANDICKMIEFLVDNIYMSSNIPSAPAYGVYASQLIRYAHCCSSYSDFLIRHRALVKRLLSQGYKVNRLSNTFKKFYGRHTDLVGQYKKNVCQMFADSIS